MLRQETDIFRNLKIGTVDREAVFVDAILVRQREDQGPELAITADIRRSGHCVGGGQSLDTVAAVAKRGHLAPRLTPALVEGLLDIWERWHLNGTRAGCEHQRDFGWHRRKLDEAKPVGWANTDRIGHMGKNANLAGWEHPPVGVLTKPCPICGYAFGSAWKYEALPDYVYLYLHNFAAVALGDRKEAKNG